MPLRQQKSAGQRSHFKAFVAIGDSNGHIGLGVNGGKKVGTAIHGVIFLTDIPIVPVCRVTLRLIQLLVVAALFPFLYRATPCKCLVLKVVQNVLLSFGVTSQRQPQPLLLRLNH
ncbi:hypothetical protein WA026_010791 [Henosepilachna vigintioctopunctata]|uniref:S5 DRBM domain-containing protein n=1 Tax=Henosepilachna vigintioctopunctata TaxID=420089 RepID=A0AAW1UP65_9CUCU